MKKSVQKLLALFVNLKNSMIVLVFFVVFVLGNVFVSKLPLRLDFSTNKAYSLSPASKNIIKALKNDVELVLFVSANLPPQVKAVRQDAVDLLGEYVRSSGGKIKLTTLDPITDPKAKERAQKLGVQELQFRSIANNNFQVLSSYYGLSLVMGDKDEAIPGLVSPETLEFDITSALFKLSQEKPVKIGVLGASKISQSGDAYSLIRSALTKLYDSQQLPLATSSAGIDFSGISTVLAVADSDTPFNENSVKSIENFVTEGGNLVLYVDGVSIRGMTGTLTNQEALQTLLKKLGLSLGQSLVEVSEGEVVQFGSEGQILLAKYPFWFNTNNFDEKNPLLAGISSLGFNWTSPLEVDGSSSAKPKILVKTLPNATASANIAVLNPQTLGTKTGGKDSLALVAQGSLGKGSVTVWGTARALEDDFLQRSPGNFAFVYNLLSYYTSGGALSGIRSRQVGVVPIRPMLENRKETYKWLIVGASPLMLGVVGLIVIRARRKV